MPPPCSPVQLDVVGYKVTLKKPPLSSSFYSTPLMNQGRPIQNLRQWQLSPDVADRKLSRMCHVWSAGNDCSSSRNSCFSAQQLGTGRLDYHSYQLIEKEFRKLEVAILEDRATLLHRLSDCAKLQQMTHQDSRRNWRYDEDEDVGRASRSTLNGTTSSISSLAMSTWKPMFNVAPVHDESVRPISNDPEQKQIFVNCDSNTTRANFNLSSQSNHHPSHAYLFIDPSIPLTLPPRSPTSLAEDCSLHGDKIIKTATKNDYTPTVFASPLSERMMRLDLTKLSRSDKDWRTMTGIRPKDPMEELIIDRLVKMERLQALTIELERGWTKQKAPPPTPPLPSGGSATGRGGVVARPPSVTSSARSNQPLASNNYPATTTDCINAQITRRDQWCKSETRNRSVGPSSRTSSRISLLSLVSDKPTTTSTANRSSAVQPIRSIHSNHHHDDIINTEQQTPPSRPPSQWRATNHCRELDAQSQNCSPSRDQSHDESCDQSRRLRTNLSSSTNDVEDFFNDNYDIAKTPPPPPTARTLEISVECGEGSQPLNPCPVKSLSELSAKAGARGRNKGSRRLSLSQNRRVSDVAIIMPIDTSKLRTAVIPVKCVTVKTSVTPSHRRMTSHRITTNAAATSKRRPETAE